MSDINSIRAKFDVLDQLTIAYYGKQMYFLEPDGRIYDMQKDEYIDVDEAVRRLANAIWEMCG